jgi:DNA-binding CsgD family transcriptional regulator
MALRLTAALLDPHQIMGDTAREQWEWTQRAIALPGGSPQAQAAALSVAVWATQTRSDEFEVRTFGEAALELARGVGDDLGIANAASALGTVMLHAGDVEGARKLLTEALDRFRQVGALGRSAWTLCHLAFLDSHDAIDEGGDVEALDGALACYEEALVIFRDLVHPRGIARALHGIAYLMFKKRDLPGALVRTQEVLAMEWEQRWPLLFCYQEDIADIAGRTGQPAAAARLYGAASAQRAKLGLPIDPPFRAEYERDVAVARQTLGETDFAAHWTRGLSLTEEQAIAEALSVTIPQEPDALGATVALPVSLSRRELEVMRLLASGLSDRSIADALFIGERTVNTHVAHIYAKLGVRNRGAAVTAAAAAGLVAPDAVRSGPGPAGSPGQIQAENQ